MKLSVIFIVALSWIESGNADASEEVDIGTRWKELDQELKSTVGSLIKKAMPTIMESSGKVNLSSQCLKESFQVVSGLKNLKLWAFKFMDSSSKSLDGIMAGTWMNLGNYRECLETVVPNKKDPQQPLFRGQHCTIGLSPPLPPHTKRYRIHGRLEELRNYSGSELFEEVAKKVHMFYYFKFMLGVCIPSGCSQYDLEQIIEQVGEKLGLNGVVYNCEVKEDPVLTNQQILIISVCSILSFLVLTGTAKDMRNGKKNVTFVSKTSDFLLCFSVIRNFKKLISTKSSKENFRCLNGMKFLSITWVVMGHCYSYRAVPLTINRSILHMEKISSGLFIQTITNSAEVVDTFLFIAGLLVSYLTLRHVMIEKKRFDIKRFILHRIIRIWPAYAVVVLFATLTPLLGSGPLYKKQTWDVQNCDSQWWRNLLFISNFFSLGEMCMMHTWYLAVDFQLYLISPLIVLIIARCEKFGVFLNFMIIVASIVYTGVITYVKKLPIGLIPEFLLDPKDFADFYLYSYGNTLSRAGPYFIGVYIGYVIASQPNLKMAKPKLWLGWCVATVSSAMVVYATALWYAGIVPSNLGFLLYATLYKVAWTTGVAWMTLCCITGHGGFVNTILSWKLWTPLSKLVFLVYLIQPLWYTITIAMYDGAQDFSHLMQITQFFGMLCISYLLAMVLNMLVEVPVLNLEKMFFSAPQKTTQDSGHQNNGYAIDLSSEITHARTEFNFATYDKENKM